VLFTPTPALSPRLTQSIRRLRTTVDLDRMAAAEGLVGKYTLESSEKFDEFLKEMGVGFVTRKMAVSLSPTIEIKQEGEEYSIKTSTTFKTTELKFKLGEEFEETRMDGVTVKTKINKDGDSKLVQNQFGEVPCEIVREVVGDSLKTVCTCNEVVSTRIYKRVK